MMVDWTVSIGNVIQIITLLAAGLTIFIGISYRMRGVEKELEKLSSVIVSLAVQKTEIDHLRKRVDELCDGRRHDGYTVSVPRHNG
jgi:hypothetical protein